MIYLKGDNVTKNATSDVSDRRFKDNFKIAMGVEQREYDGMVQDCKFDEKTQTWIPWGEWRHRRIEEDKANRKKVHEGGVLIGVKNPTPYEVKIHKKDGTLTTEIEHKYLYKSGLNRTR